MKYIFHKKKIMSENYLGCSTSQIITPNNPKWKRNLKWISRPIKLRSSTPACKIFPYQFSISIKFNHAAQQILHCSIKNITWKISKSTTIFKISVHILQKFSAHTVYVNNIQTVVATRSTSNICHVCTDWERECHSKYVSKMTFSKSLLLIQFSELILKVPGLNNRRCCPYTHIPCKPEFVRITTKSI